LAGFEAVAESVDGSLAGFKEAPESVDTSLAGFARPPRGDRLAMEWVIDMRRNR